MSIATVGAFVFGIVIGWITYRTLRRREGAALLSDLATVIGAVGGAAVTAIFEIGDMFGAYCIGLGVGFFLYFLIALRISGKKETGVWMD